MTEAEYRQLPGVDRLPLYDEDDDRCEQLGRPNSSQTDVDEAERCIADNSLEFRGGIRYRSDDGIRFVFAYFWKLR